MKVVLVLAVAVLAVALAVPVAEVPVYKIVTSEFDVNPEGSYKYNFETENNIARDESGTLKVVKDEEGHEHSVGVAQGSYSYTDPEGHVVSLRYFADETGFHPEAEHLPKA